MAGYIVSIDLRCEAKGDLDTVHSLLCSVSGAVKEIALSSKGVHNLLLRSNYAEMQAMDTSSPTLVAQEL